MAFASGVGAGLAAGESAFGQFNPLRQLQAKAIQSEIAGREQAQSFESQLQPLRVRSLQSQIDEQEKFSKFMDSIFPELDRAADGAPPEIAAQLKGAKEIIRSAVQKTPPGFAGANPVGPMAGLGGPAISDQPLPGDVMGPVNPRGGVPSDIMGALESHRLQGMEAGRQRRRMWLTGVASQPRFLQMVIPPDILQTLGEEQRMGLAQRLLGESAQFRELVNQGLHNDLPRGESVDSILGIQ